MTGSPAHPPDYATSEYSFPGSGEDVIHRVNAIHHHTADLPLAESTG